LEIVRLVYQDLLDDRVDVCKRLHDLPPDARIARHVRAHIDRLQRQLAHRGDDRHR